MQKSGCNNFYMYKYHQKSLFFLKKIAFTLAKLAFSYANSSFYAIFQKVAFTFSINLIVLNEKQCFKIQYIQINKYIVK